MFEVHAHYYGRPRVQSGPMQGCWNFPTHHWVKLSHRPIGRKRAEALANAETHRAVVTRVGTSETVYDNGKEPATPAG